MNFFVYFILYALVVTTCVVLIMVLGLVAFSIFINKVWTPYRYKTMHMSIEEMYNNLALIIQNEIDLYERSVFENGGQFLNNQTFENYYKDICRKIGEDIPDEFYKKFGPCMDETAVKRFIARTVKAYLETKIIN